MQKRKKVCSPIKPISTPYVSPFPKETKPNMERDKVGVVLGGWRWPNPRILLKPDSNQMWWRVLLKESKSVTMIKLPYLVRMRAIPTKAYALLWQSVGRKGFAKLRYWIPLTEMLERLPDRCVRYVHLSWSVTQRVLMEFWPNFNTFTAG